MVLGPWKARQPLGAGALPESAFSHPREMAGRTWTVLPSVDVSVHVCAPQAGQHQGVHAADL